MSFSLDLAYNGERDFNFLPQEFNNTTGKKKQGYFLPRINEIINRIKKNRIIQEFSKSLIPIHELLNLDSTKINSFNSSNSSKNNSINNNNNSHSINLTINENNNNENENSKMNWFLNYKKQIGVLMKWRKKNSKKNIDYTQKDYSNHYRILVCGMKGAGKTTLINRLLKLYGISSKVVQETSSKFNLFGFFQIHYFYNFDNFIYIY